MSSIATPPISPSATFCFHTIRMRNARSRANGYPMRAVPMASQGGNTSTSRRLPKRLAKAVGVSMAKILSSIIARRMSKKTVELLRAQLRGRAGLFPPADIGLVLHWSNYSAKSVALIQARGIPIDIMLWNLVQENKAAVIRELIRQFDPSYGSEHP